MIKSIDTAKQSMDRLFGQRRRMKNRDIAVQVSERTRCAHCRRRRVEEAHIMCWVCEGEIYGDTSKRTYRAG